MTTSHRSSEDTTIAISPKRLAEDDETEIIRPDRAIVYRGVLLDIDGTLVDSNDAHASAWFEALKEMHRFIRQLPQTTPNVLSPVRILSPPSWNEFNFQRTTS